MASMNLIEKIMAWMKIAGLTFYPLSFIMYTVGALICPKAYNQFDFYSYLAKINLLKKSTYNKRIDGIMQLALSYIIWVGIVPLIYFL